MSEASHLPLEPSPQELNLLALQAGAYDSVSRYIEEQLALGRSPSFLSIIRPDILIGFAEQWHAVTAGHTPSSANSSKQSKFAAYSRLAENGDPAAISTLPKLATTTDEVTHAMDLTLDYRDAVAAWRSGRQYLQSMGTYDPQHTGHRVLLMSALAALGDQTSIMLNLIGKHPFKPDISRPYDTRYDESEQRLLLSPLVDSSRVTQIDIPGGVGLGLESLAQMELLAAITGDDVLRWLIGSDLFRTNVQRLRTNQNAIQATMRFAHPRLHAYVVYRQPDTEASLAEDKAFAEHAYGTPITFIERQPYNLLPDTSSTRVKQLRDLGHFTLAQQMELGDIIES